MNHYFLDVNAGDEFFRIVEETRDPDVHQRYHQAVDDGKHLGLKSGDKIYLIGAVRAETERNIRNEITKSNAKIAVVRQR